MPIIGRIQLGSLRRRVGRQYRVVFGFLGACQRMSESSAWLWVLREHHGALLPSFPFVAKPRQWSCCGFLLRFSGFSLVQVRNASPVEVVFVAGDHRHSKGQPCTGTIMQLRKDQLNLFLLEDTVWILQSETGVSTYDFSFETIFPCCHRWRRSDEVLAVGRFGAVPNYGEFFEELLGGGIRLVHTPLQKALASELAEWYPLIQGLTPRSECFPEPPPASTIENLFDWPVFLKGSRQTSKHNPELSIARSRDDYERIRGQYGMDPILRWQPFVCREFIRLRSVSGKMAEKIPPSFEFRTFWWRGNCIGAGPYWGTSPAYTWTREEESDALAIASKAVERLKVPFLVVDVAQTVEGSWVIIECNDGQECGYAGISPISLWLKLVAVERKMGFIG